MIDLIVGGGHFLLTIGIAGFMYKAFVLPACDDRKEIRNLLRKLETQQAAHEAGCTEWRKSISMRMDRAEAKD